MKFAAARALYSPPPAVERRPAESVQRRATAPRRERPGIINWDPEVASASSDVTIPGMRSGISGSVTPPMPGSPRSAAPRNSRVVCDESWAPGYRSCPAFGPANTVAQQNTAWRDATVYLTPAAGDYRVAVDGHATGLTRARRHGHGPRPGQEQPHPHLRPDRPHLGVGAGLMAPSASGLLMAAFP